jgi:peptidyl-prolyl cis-trans isomerase C
MLIATRITRFAAAVFILAALADAPAFAAEKKAAPSVSAAEKEKKGPPPGDTVIATLGGDKITLDELDTYIAALPDNVRPMAMMQRTKMLDTVISRRLIYRFAEGKGYASEKGVKDYLKRARREIMIRMALQDLQEEWKPMTEEIKKEYEKNKGKFQDAAAVTAAHIMVTSEKEAKDLLAKLKKKGADFADLAKKYSLAPERANGGSLGKMTKGQHQKTGLPAIIEETAFSLEAGGHSGIVRSQFGWHIVYTSAKDKVRQMPFKEVRSSIEEKLSDAKRESSLKSLLSRLGKKYEVKKFPDRIP